ncbi:methyl-accepting chemotaxis protein [Amaricoccus tamworthensis]|uniref:methyl-accepting chemotaxis protein n=1 Tax=Amaricoccus tamworthensis TaxID=57002 RepID=UPI003C7D99ED
MKFVRDLPVFPKVFSVSAAAGLVAIGLMLLERNAAVGKAASASAESASVGFPFVDVIVAVLIVLAAAAGLGLLLSGSAKRLKSRVDDLENNKLDTLSDTYDADEFGQISKGLAKVQKALWEKGSTTTNQMEFYEALHAAQCVFSVNPDGSIRYANQNFLKCLGIEDSEIAGTALAARLDERFADSNAFQNMWAAAASGKAASGTLVFADGHGATRTLRGGFSGLNDAKGRFHQTVFVGAEQVEAAPLPSSKPAADEQTTALVGEVDQALKSLASGDLTVRMKSKSDCEYDYLRKNFNFVAKKLDDAIAAVVNSSNSILWESDQLASASSDLSHRTENQAAALEETAASLEQLTASVKTAAEGAEKANSDAETTKRNAEESGRIVDTAIDAMNEIEKSSDHISQIIGVIDDIAFQTNLLALNAGVEAARAGDAGRGFAVVASEVRALAQRSSNAAKEIKTLITTSSEQVGRGVELVQETGKALKTIVESVKGVSALVDEIAVSAKEQAVGLTEINTAVNQLDQVTQQNAAMVEESTAASRALKSDADDLAKLVSDFKTKYVETVKKAQRDAAAAKPAAAPAKPVTVTPPAAPKAAAPVPPKPKPAPMPTPATNGSSALALEPRHPVDDWEDF